MGRYGMSAEEADDHYSEYGDLTVQQAIDRNQSEDRASIKIEIFGSSSCPYCVKAKEFCEKNGYTYSYKNMDEDFEAFDQLVGRIKSWKTVPQIFIGAKHIGGYEDLVKELGET